MGQYRRRLIAIVPIAAGAYVATNMDNFILLISLGIRGQVRRYFIAIVPRIQIA